MPKNRASRVGHALVKRDPKIPKTPHSAVAPNAVQTRTPWGLPAPTTDPATVAPGLLDLDVRGYPRLNGRLEAHSAPGLFVIGAAAHGNGWRQGNGGSIRGFRHRIQALVRQLQDAWPSAAVPLAELPDFVAERAHTAAGPVHAALCDVALLACSQGTSEYYFELPQAEREARFGSSPHLEWSFVRTEHGLRARVRAFVNAQPVQEHAARQARLLLLDLAAVAQLLRIACSA